MTFDPAFSGGPHRTLVCAIIITYHPDNEFPQRVHRIAKQVARVLIVDNHSNAEALAMVRALCTESGLRDQADATPGTLAEMGASIEVIANTENCGIAAALNQGAQWAREAGFAWLLMFDQDSLVSETLVDALAEAYAQQAISVQAAPSPGQAVAMIGANYRRTGDGQFGYPLMTTHPARAEGWMPAAYVITSGCLLSLDAYAVIGPFREDFFIDYVDIEYCFRARARDFLLIVTRDCLMEHTVGAMTAHHFLRTWWVSNYAAWRWYYRARNLTLTSRAFFRREPHWVGEAWLNLLVTCAKILLFEPDKAAKMRSIGRGLWRGLRDNPSQTK